MASRKKEKTQEQAAAMQAKAVRFLRDVVGDNEKADTIEGLTVSEYGARKGLVFTNPVPELKKAEWSTKKMANESGTSTITKADLEAENSELLDLLNDVWNELSDVDNTTNKAQAIEAIDSVCEMLNEYDEENFPMESDADDDAQEDAEAA